MEEERQQVENFVRLFGLEEREAGQPNTSA
jgi:hypothetical protein